MSKLCVGTMLAVRSDLEKENYMEAVMHLMPYISVKPTKSTGPMKALGEVGVCRGIVSHIAPMRPEGMEGVEERSGGVWELPTRIWLLQIPLRAVLEQPYKTSHQKASR